MCVCPCVFLCSGEKHLKLGTYWIVFRVRGFEPDTRTELQVTREMCSGLFSPLSPPKHSISKTNKSGPSLSGHRIQSVGVKS